MEKEKGRGGECPTYKKIIPAPRISNKCTFKNTNSTWYQFLGIFSNWQLKSTPHTEHQICEVNWWKLIDWGLMALSATQIHLNISSHRISMTTEAYCQRCYGQISQTTKIHFTPNFEPFSWLIPRTFREILQNSGNPTINARVCTYMHRAN